MMTAETYKKISAPFRLPERIKGLVRLNKVLTILTYLAYIGLVVSQLVLDLQTAWRILLIPAIGFVGVTIFRKLFNAKRPYQLLEIEPLIAREKQGQSFPSRHIFSIFMITMAIGYVCWPLGMAYAVLGVILAYVRVVGGVHFPKDVIAGAAIAILWGHLGFLVLLA